MQDRVADVLAQRAALDRGAGAGIALSVLLHGGLAGIAVYMALHAPPPQPATMVNIHFANLPAPAAPKPAQARPAAPPAAAPAVPKIDEPKPVISEPKPQPPEATPPPKPQKNTVPLSPFGQSTKKGSESPAPAPPPPAAGPAGAGTSTAPEIAIGGSGIAGIEGGEFPHTLYLQAMHRKIGGFWYRPSVPPGTTVAIYLRIERDGRISESRIATPSGNPTFDRAALSAVRSANPLNRLPNTYNGTYVGITMIFR